MRFLLAVSEQDIEEWKAAHPDELAKSATPRGHQELAQDLAAAYWMKNPLFVEFVGQWQGELLFMLPKKRHSEERKN